MSLKNWLTYTWRLGHVRGVEVRFHSSILFSIYFAYIIFRPNDLARGVLALLWLTGFIFSIFFHELAHALAAKRASIEVKNIVLWLLGGFTNLVRASEKPLHRLVISAAGPIITLLLAVLFFLIYFFMPSSLSLILDYLFPRLFISLAVVNAILFVFNILPVYPLDGGHILHSLSEFIFGKRYANIITMLISIPVLGGLIWLGVRSRDYILLASCILIAIAVGTLNKHTLRWISLGLNYLLKRGGYHFLREDYERAVKYYSRDIAREPNQLNNYIARFVCYLWMLEWEKALYDIERALEIAPDNAMALVMRGDLHVLNKEYDSALGVISRACEIKPDWAPAHIDHGSVLLDMGDPESALQKMNLGISLQTDIPAFFIARSMAYFKLGDLNAAHNDQDFALQLSEKDALIKPEFSIVGYEGYLDWAEDFYGRVIQVKPQSNYAYQGRADAYRVNNEFQRSVEDYTKALEITPNDPLLYLARGRSYKAMDETELAAADFLQVLKLTDKLHLKHHAEVLLQSIGYGSNENNPSQETTMESIELE